MSTKPLQLEGHITDPEDARTQAVHRLTQELRAARTRVDDLEEELRMATQQSARTETAARALRAQLKPLYDSLRMLFGSFESFEFNDQAPSMFGGGTAPSAPATGNYEKWKQRFPGKTAAVIEALESHPMSRDQVRVATASGWSTVDECLKKLRDIGLISKNGAGKWALKEL